MVVGLLLLDEEGRIVLANQALGQLFGLEMDLRGKTVIEAFRLHQLSALVERLALEKLVRDFELKLPGLDERLLEVNAAAIVGHGGALEGAIFVFHDITRLKQLENTRQEFVANVSHELRTPLSLIKGFVETLLAGAKDDPVVAARFLNTISKHADRLTYLIEDLLTISKLESGQLAMNRSEFSLHELVQRVTSDLASKATEKQTAVTNRIDPSLTMHGDIDRFEEVFVNLLENS